MLVSASVCAIMVLIMKRTARDSDVQVMFNAQSLMVMSATFNVHDSPSKGANTPGSMAAKARVCALPRCKRRDAFADCICAKHSQENCVACSEEFV